MARKKQNITTDERDSIISRIDKTAALLQAMLNELRRLKADEKLLKRAETYLNLGIVAAEWSLEDSAESQILN